MPKTIPSALFTHKSGGVLTTSRLLYIECVNGTILRMTNINRDEVYDASDGHGEQTWYSATGLQMTTIEATNDLSVDNAEARTFMPIYPMPGISEDMVNKGELDGALYWVYEHDYENGAAGDHEIMASGILGRCRMEQGLVAIPELRSWTQLLDQTGIISQTCLDCRSKRFGSQEGDEREWCGYNANYEWVPFTITAIGDETVREFYTDDLPEGLFPSESGEGYFAPGMVRMTTGNNAGISVEVDAFVPGDSGAQAYVGTRFTFRNPHQVGDTGEIRRECSRKWDGHNSCFTFFGSQRGAHFNGEPFINIGDSKTNSIPGVNTSTDTGGTGGSTYTPGAGDNEGGGATNPVSTSPTRTVGTTVVDPVDYGADPTGVADSTAAWNAAYADLPTGTVNPGGIVRPSAGTYKIDPDTSIQPVSHTLLDLATNNVTLRASYTTVDHKYVLMIRGVTDVEVAGGTIYGYRNLGPVPSGTTAEWGHCIACYGSQRITVRDITLRDAMGDGMSVGGYQGNGCLDIIIKNVTSLNNRRQGLSIVWANGLTVDGGTFGDTNGTSPECGIDIEPESNSVAKNITIKNASFTNNHKYGINILQRSDGGTVDQITVDNCVIGGPATDGSDGNNSNGLVTTNGSNVLIKNCTIEYNSATGIVVNNTTNLAINSNSFKNNYFRNGPTTRTVRDVTGVESPYTDKDILVKAAGPGLTIGTNHYLSN